MHQYHNLIKEILANGEDCTDRTGTGTKAIFGAQMRFNLAHGFPIVTTKAVPFKSVLSELLWFLKGSTNVNDLRALLHGEEHRDDWSKKTIWDDNAANQGAALGYTDGELGPIYGSQWRSWRGAGENYDTHGILNQTETVDQLAMAIDTIKNNPDSRRIIVNAWNVMDIDKMALPPCHVMFQFRVMNGKLHCQLYQRSADTFLGVPFNIASYALLTHMVAQVCGLQPGEFIWTGGDVHLYNDHIPLAEELLCREVRPLPLLNIRPHRHDIDGFGMDDFFLQGYNPHPPIKAKMAI